jgi:hypothetical protein
VALVLPVLAAAAAASADEIYLKSGGQFSGRIISRTAASVEMDIGAGQIGVPMSSVLRIEEGHSALQEYHDRAGRLGAGDVEGWLALGSWASAQGLGTQAREAWSRALHAAPDDPRPHAALGHVLVDGRWLTEDEAYAAQGYVQFEGEWMTPAEQVAILNTRAAEDERDRAESRAREAEAKAQEAEARAREAEAAAAAAPAAPAYVGVGVGWYGWGAGPAVWPARPVVTPPVARPVARPRPVRR